MITLNRSEIKTFCTVARKALNLPPRRFDQLRVSVSQDRDGITLSIQAAIQHGTGCYSRTERRNVAYTFGDGGPAESHCLSAGSLRTASGPRSETATLRIADSETLPGEREPGKYSVLECPAGTDNVEPWAPGEPMPAAPLLSPVPGLVSVLREAEQFTEPESTRYALGGCQLRPEGLVVATDSRRLVVLHSDPFPWVAPLVLPAMRFWKNSAFRKLDDVAVGLANPVDNPGGDHGAGDTITGGTVTLSVGNWRFDVNVAEGRFPRYADVIPTEHTSSAVIDPTDRAKVLELLPAIPEGENCRAVDVELNGRVRISVPHGEERRTDVILSRSRRDGDEVCCTLDRNFLADMLRFGGRMDFRGSEAAVVARNKRGTMVLMPLVPDYSDGRNQTVSALPKHYPDAETVYT